MSYNFDGRAFNVKLFTECSINSLIKNINNLKEQLLSLVHPILNKNELILPNTLTCPKVHVLQKIEKHSILQKITVRFQ